MNKKLIKYLMKLSFPTIGIICLIKYWSSELIVDKIHYGIFMLVMMIISMDNNRNNGNQKTAN